MPRYIHTARVQGVGEFPLDMLRYDRCTPHREEDSARIPIDSRRTAGEWVEIQAATDSKVVPWTVARWHSFGWRIEHLQTRKSV
jgi:hypothetical protein